jgi:hypothetical protein
MHPGPLTWGHEHTVGAEDRELPTSVSANKVADPAPLIAGITAFASGARTPP